MPFPAAVPPAADKPVHNAALPAAAVPIAADKPSDDTQPFSSQCPNSC